MAKFSVAEEITGRFEGLYANNPKDRGGETYAGIARNFWGNWDGWNVIDAIKEKYGTKPAIINFHASKDAFLNKLISQFYKKNFWDVNKLDLIQDQQLANNVYDFGVNSGTGRAAKFLQQSANDTGLVKLVVDGKIGNATLTAINSLSPELVYNNFNARKTAFYKSIAVGDQAGFLKSWLSRVKPYKSCA